MPCFHKSGSCPVRVTLSSSGCTCLAVLLGAALSMSVVVWSRPGAFRRLTLEMSDVVFGNDGVVECSGCRRLVDGAIVVCTYVIVGCELGVFLFSKVV